MFLSSVPSPYESGLCGTNKDFLHAVSPLHFLLVVEVEVQKDRNVGLVKIKTGCCRYIYKKRT